MEIKLPNVSVKRYAILFISLLLLALIFGGLVTPLVPRTSAAPNLVTNGSLETRGLSGDPENWLRGGYGTNDRRFTYPVRGVDGPSAVRVEMADRTSGDAKWFFRDIEISGGESYTYSHQYRANVTTELLARFKRADGTIRYYYLGSLPPSASWTTIHRMVTVPDDAVSMTVFHLLYSEGYLEIDGVQIGSTKPVAENLIENASIETATAGGQPEDWIRGGYGNNDRTFTYPVAGVEGSDAARVEMTTRVTGDAKWFFDDVAVAPRESYTLSHKYRSNATTELLIRYTTESGVRYQYLGTFPPSSTWKTVTREIVTPADATKLTVFHLLYSVGFLEIDGFSLSRTYTNGVPVPNNTIATAAEKVSTIVDSIPNPLKEDVSAKEIVDKVSSTVLGTLSFPVKEWGVHVGWRVEDMQQFVSTVGKVPKYRVTFVHWGNENRFPYYLATDLTQRKQTLIVFWEATNYNIGSVEQPLYNYDSIISGRWDNYLAQFASDIKAYGGPVILIPFSEMNGNWFPWSGLFNGNTPAKHNQAYRYVYEFFRNVPNVSFGWAPNSTSVPDLAANAIALYYPGDEYVDYVGLDGFNFGSPWMSFDALFGDALEVVQRYKKPIFIFSFASTAGTQKATWISDALNNQIPKYPSIKAWVWFNENKERDWRINSDAESLRVFKNALP